MNYGKYKNLRDAAWLCLIEFEFNQLPIQVLDIARALGITVLKYSQVKKDKLKPKESGTTVFIGDKIYIIYRDSESIQRCRFTIAHELGHILLGHKLTENRYFRKFDTTKPEIETEADMFASRLLAPACVLWGLNLHTADEIAKVCNISKKAAQARADRMATLYKRNKFLTSRLERAVFNNFRDFVNKNKM